MIKSALCLVLSFFSMAAAADTLFSCEGRLDGYAYYHPGGLVPDKSVGWTEDGLDVQYTVTDDDANEVDVLFVDASRNIKSAKAAGAAVILLGATDENITILTTYSGEVVEVLQYFRERKSLVLSQFKAGGVINKSAMYEMKCN